MAMYVLCLAPFKQVTNKGELLWIKNEVCEDYKILRIEKFSGIFLLLF